MARAFICSKLPCLFSWAWAVFASKPFFVKSFTLKIIRLGMLSKKASKFCCALRPRKYVSLAFIVAVKSLKSLPSSLISKPPSKMNFPPKKSFIEVSGRFVPFIFR